MLRWFEVIWLAVQISSNQSECLILRRAQVCREMINNPNDRIHYIQL